MGINCLVSASSHWFYIPAVDLHLVVTNLAVIIHRSLPEVLYIRYLSIGAHWVGDMILEISFRCFPTDFEN